MSSFLGQKNLVRGLRNNNPGNLVITSIAWHGKIPNSQNTDGKFEQFTSLEYGIRAMLKDLINDINKGKNTLTKLINEYAPAFENNTNAYINSVAKTLGISATGIIKVIDRPLLKLLARAIMKVELGAQHTKVTDSHIDKAIDLIGEVKLSNVSVSATPVKRCTSCGAILAGLTLFFYTGYTIYCLIH